MGRYLLEHPDPFLALRRHRAGGGVVALFLDYDGTLVPLAEHPEQATASPRVVALLERLAEEGYRVVVVTGRSRESLAKVLGYPKGCSLAFLHGWEILWDGTLLHPWGDPPPLPPSFLDTLALLRVPGAALEHKGQGIALHYRRVESARKEEVYRAFREAFARFPLLHGVYELLEGKDVIEVRPRGASKGRAVAWVRKRLAKQGPLYLAAFGDDTTDEEMFQAIGADGLTVAVGDKPLPSARWWVPTPREVWQALSLLVET